MRLEFKNNSFSENFEFHARLTRKCLVCNSHEIQTSQYGALCRCCGSLLQFE